MLPEEPQSPRDAASAKRHFLVSRTGADAAWAEWIAWQLEAEGFTVVIQDWDFGPGVNFVHKMQQASKDTERTLAVLSPRYFNSPFTEAEWTAAFYSPGWHARSQRALGDAADQQSQSPQHGKRHRRRQPVPVQS